MINNRQKQYDHDKDIYSYISFWEDIWSKKGLLFQGNVWHFKLANLYVKSIRYDKAINFLNDLTIKKPEYCEKSQYFIQIKNGNTSTSSKPHNNTSNYQENESYSDYSHKGTKFKKAYHFREDKKLHYLPKMVDVLPKCFYYIMFLSIFI